LCRSTQPGWLCHGLGRHGFWQSLANHRGRRGQLFHVKHSGPQLCVGPVHTANLATSRAGWLLAAPGQPPRAARIVSRETFRRGGGDFAPFCTVKLAATRAGWSSGSSLLANQRGPAEIVSRETFGRQGNTWLFEPFQFECGRNLLSGTFHTRLASIPAEVGCCFTWTMEKLKQRAYYDVALLRPWN
jgi:hypothetical protein